MEPVTVTFNGPKHVQSVTEIPDDTLTAGEYLAALVDAHALDGIEHELVMADGEPVPADLDVALLSGLTVNVRSQHPVELVADEPVPYEQWTKADLWAEIQARQTAGETVDAVASANKPDMVAALEQNDATRADAVFVEPDGTVALADGEVVGEVLDAEASAE